MELKIFENSEFGRIRTLLDDNGTVLFCGSDVAQSLGYRNPSRDVKRHCKRAQERCTTDSVGRRQQMLFIPEADVYRLIIRSKLPTAELFETWVVETVLPTLRRHGAYITPEVLSKMEESPEFTSQLVRMLKQQQEKDGDLREQMATMAMKADYFDKLVDTDTLTNIRQTAKELHLPEKLFTYLLVEMGFAYRAKRHLLLPYAFMVTSGFAELKEYTNGNHGGIYMLFTPVGRLYLARKIARRLAAKSVEVQDEKITTSELRQMTGKEGLILQGCGGDLNEWVDGINGMLTDEGILQNGDMFKEVSAFEHDGCTNLLFHMDHVDLDGGKLAMWRLKTHENFAGTWLSDYVPNRLGGFA